METWFIIIISLCISIFLKSLFSFKSKKLPPGPLTVPIIGNILWLTKSLHQIEPILRNLKLKYGPIITLHLGSRPAIIITNHYLAHKTLIQNGAIFSDRPSYLPTSAIVDSNQHSISSAAYGPTWRILRRNLTAEMLHPARVKSYSHARRWILDVLIRRLNCKEGPVAVVQHLRYVVFCLFVLMCFGDKMDENKIKEIERVEQRLLLNFDRNNRLNIWPSIGKVLFRNRWKVLLEMRKDQEEALIPLIKSRVEFIKRKKQVQINNEDDIVVAYVDTLVGLEVPEKEEKKRKLTIHEIVTLCSEFLTAGTDTTATALQWIMANLVKYPQIQAKLYEEIVGVVGTPDKVQGPTLVVIEDDLHKMPYLKAVVLENLRRHPPSHFVLPHMVTEDVEIDGYIIPKNAMVNYMVAEMGLDPKVWSDPMMFKPERFLLNGKNVDVEGLEFDITGSKEIKMMPFGTGRRICPGSNLALLHLEYFVANLILNFQWNAVNGDEVDLSEKQEFTVMMKNPFRAHISPRVLF